MCESGWCASVSRPSAVLIAVFKLSYDAKYKMLYGTFIAIAVV
jgi:hypothetical protein